MKPICKKSYEPDGVLFERTLHAYLASFAGVLGMALLLALPVAANRAGGAVVIAVMAAGAAGSYAVARSGSPRAAAVAFLVWEWAVVTGFLALSGGVRSYVWILCAPLVVVAGLLFHNRGAILCALAFSLSGMVLLLFEKRLPASLFPYPSPALLPVTIITFVLLIIPLRMTLNSLMASLHIVRGELARREQTEKALIESEERLRAVLDSINDVVLVHDPQTGAILKANQRASDLFGYTREEMLRLRVEGFSSGVSPYTQSDAMARMTYAMKEGSSVFEWRARHRTGRLFWVEVSMRRAVIGGEARLLAAIRDITARKQAQEEQSRLINIIEQTTEDIVLTDTEGRIQYVNPAFERLTGYRLDEVQGKTLAFLKSGRHPAPFYAEIWTTIRQGRTWSGRLFNRRKDGKIILQEALISPLFDRERELGGFVSIRRDITEIADLESRLLQAQKMESIGTLAGGIAHDFNNILSSIIGFTELARTDLKDQTQPAEDLERVLQASMRAKDLVRQILTFSRQQDQEKTRVQLGPLVKEASKFLRSALPATIDIQCEIQGDLPEVAADPTQMHQVLMNLATNAGHAIRGKNGTLKIQLLGISVDREFALAHPPLAEGPHVHLQISDNGHGMSREVLDRIFEPFFTTKPHGEGTGLGLSVVYGIVKAHQGTITVYSQPGIGTTFHVYLPALAGGPKEEPVTQEQIPKGKGEHILYVDDEPSMCQLAERVLPQLGYVVTALSSSEEAINLFGWDAHSFDLVISDLTMPGLSGTDLVGKIRQLKPDIPVILASGIVSPELRASARKLGIQEILTKPFTTAILAGVVSRALNKTVGAGMVVAMAPSDNRNSKHP